MTHPGTPIMIMIVVVASIGVVPAAALTGTAATPASGPGQSGSEQVATGATELPPGAVFSGVVGVQDAELDGNLERATFGLQVSRAASDRAKAALLANRFNESQRRLTELRQRLAVLNRSRNNGSISTGTFAARASTVTAQLGALERIGNDMGNVSHRLPADVLVRAGVNASAIDLLRRDAATMSGPEMAAIARTIAGPDIGGGPPPFANATRGPPVRDGQGPSEAGNQSADSGTEPALGDQEGEPGSSGDDPRGVGNGTARGGNGGYSDTS